MSNPTPGGERRTDHRAYAITCPRPKCAAAPWRACLGRGGMALDEPHRERVRAEKGAGTTAKQRTPTLGPLFEDPTVRVVARNLNAEDEAKS
mgnify:CR=1 FL=1